MIEAMRKPLPHPKPTEGELELLRVLWRKGSATVREIHEAIIPTRPVRLHVHVEAPTDHVGKGIGSADRTWKSTRL